MIPFPTHQILWKSYITILLKLLVHGILRRFLWIEV